MCVHKCKNKNIYIHTCLYIRVMLLKINKVIISCFRLLDFYFNYILSYTLGI